MGKVWFVFTVMMIVGFIGGPLVYFLLEKPTPVISSGSRIEYSAQYKYANGTTGNGGLTITYSKGGSVLVMKIETDLPGITNLTTVVSAESPYSLYTVTVGNVTFAIVFPFIILPGMEDLLRNPQYTLIGYNTVRYTTVSQSTLGNDAAQAEYIIEIGSNLIKTAKFTVTAVYDNGTWRAPKTTDYPNGTVIDLTLTLKSTSTSPRYILGFGLYSTILIVVGVVGFFGFLAILVVKTLTY